VDKHDVLRLNVLLNDLLYVGVFHCSFNFLLGPATALVHKVDKFALNCHKNSADLAKCYFRCEIAILSLAVGYFMLSYFLTHNLAIEVKWVFVGQIVI
jgi:hypothetical protein